MLSNYILIKFNFIYDEKIVYTKYIYADAEKEHLHPFLLGKDLNPYLKQEDEKKRSMELVFAHGVVPRSKSHKFGKKPIHIADIVTWIHQQAPYFYKYGHLGKK